VVSAWTKRVRADVTASMPPAVNPEAGSPDGGGVILGYQVVIRTVTTPRRQLAHTDLMTAEQAEREAAAWRKHGHQADVAEVREVPG